jgi:acyl dehydratase
MAGQVVPQLFGDFGMCRQAAINFRKPVYVGDRLTFRAVVTGIHKSVKSYSLKVDVVNGEGECVATAEMQANILPQEVV